MIFDDIKLKDLHKKLCCGCSLESPCFIRIASAEAILMSTHSIGFYEEISKIISLLSSNIIKYAHSSDKGRYCTLHICT